MLWTSSGNELGLVASDAADLRRAWRAMHHGRSIVAVSMQGVTLILLQLPY
jgi:hypothetical protein